MSTNRPTSLFFPSSLNSLSTPPDSNKKHKKTMLQMKLYLLATFDTDAIESDMNFFLRSILSSELNESYLNKAFTVLNLTLLKFLSF